MSEGPLFTPEEQEQDRALAESRMPSRCTLASPASRRDWPEGADGMQTPAHVLHAADVPCRLATDDAATTAEVGDASEERARRRLDLPHDTRIPDGTVARIDSGEWAGAFWLLRDTTGKDQATALRVQVAQIEEPEGWGTWT